VKGQPRRAVLVSACLMGVPCRYDGRDKASPSLETLLRGRTPVPVCPEQLGGLPTPRLPAELVGGDGFDVWSGTAQVIDDRGRDVTEQFRRGAKAALLLARTSGARSCILKARSPSCGIRGLTGVTAALCILEGLEVLEV